MVVNDEEKITYISTPTGSKREEIIKDQEYLIKVEKSNKPPTRDFRIFYKTDKMFHPVLFFEENKDYPDEVAVAATIAPSFDHPSNEP